MIRYVLDTSSLIVIGHYFPDRFPTFWQRFDEAISEGRIVSVREVRRELDTDATRTHLRAWLKAHAAMFRTPSQEEMRFVAQIFAVPHFRQLVGQKQRLKGSPVADPFVIAGAAVHQATVISEEEEKPNAARIPNVCRHFSIPCHNLEWLMQIEGWVF